MTAWTTMGLSAQAIAYGSKDHPRDPSDLRRCIEYCRGRYSTGELRKRMAGRSPEWDRLLGQWDELCELLQHEMDTRTDGRAPRTYAVMKRLRYDGLPCGTCDSTGRGEPCPKCKGTGRRAGGKCRAPHCFDGADFCPTCRGNTYVPKEN